MSDVEETQVGWLPAEDLSEVRERMPIVYVSVVPVRLDHLGRITHVGLLLRAMPDSTISRAVVSGRVLFGETVRDAVWRHCVKDLGPDADPHLPAGLAPFTVAEYFPDAKRTGYHDPRQHAVSLCYVVEVTGECQPAQDALEFTWLTVDELLNGHVFTEMTGGHDKLVRIALAHAGLLP